MHDKSKKEQFSKPCVHVQKDKLQNYSSLCSSCAFFRKIEEKLFWDIEEINEASAIKSIINLSHTLSVIADAKVLCSFLSFALFTLLFSLFSHGCSKQKLFHFF